MARTSDMTQLDTFLQYREHDGELRELASLMRTQYFYMSKRGHSAGISDVEGELLYLLIRSMKPETVFEISPDTGWSTNYILAALTANSWGTVHSFEIRGRKKGMSTEQVIRRNQSHYWDQNRLVVHIGDAVETTNLITGGIDLLFIDSCHDGWFADWYIEKLLPRVSGIVWLEDIAFSDQLEPSYESEHVWEWIKRLQVPITHVGQLEEQFRNSSVRVGYPRARVIRGNAVFFSWPQQGQADIPKLAIGPQILMTQAEEAISRGDIPRPTDY